MIIAGCRLSMFTLLGLSTLKRSTKWCTNSRYVYKQHFINFLFNNKLESDAYTSGYSQLSSVPTIVNELEANEYLIICERLPSYERRQLLHFKIRVLSQLGGLRSGTKDETKHRVEVPLGKPKIEFRTGLPPLNKDEQQRETSMVPHSSSSFIDNLEWKKRCKWRSNHEL